jgi:2-keto-4-pentenoate hydratase/2-oxohepta-3-ene-1,7-dioic acid hydratase in catechol pathway
VQLVTFRAARTDRDRLGALVGEGVLDLASAAERAEGRGTLPTSMIELLRAGEGAMALAHDLVGAAKDDRAVDHRLDEVRLRAPLPRPNSMRDFMLVEEHVRNAFGEVPPEWYEIPVYWKGNCDAVIGPDDEVPWPRYTDKLDYELEVAAVLGRPVREASPGEAADAIAGYTIFNDWSARDIQFREMKVGLGPGLGKDFATSLGPCLTTPDAIDIDTAPMTARVNGEVWSQGSLGAMRFSFAEVIAHLSQEQTLQPGDVLGSGTVGRGCGLELDRWIAPGDVLELEVEGIGVLRNRVGVRSTANV